MFVGRDKELSALERRWSSQQFECVVVYGRRRVGKTTLINRFLEDRPTISFRQSNPALPRISNR